ncbi:MAG: carbohydrate ABC transporter permease [Hungatella sp.]
MKASNSCLKKCVIYTLLIFLSLLILLPFFWMISSSLKTSQDVFSVPMTWLPEKVIWKNFQDIWTKIPLMLFFKNSFKLAIIITFLQVLTSSFAAYPFAKMKFPGRDLIFLAYVATIAVPWQVYMIPQFIIIRKMHLADTHISLILMQAFTAFGVFLIRQSYLGIPRELSEAARIDGLSEFGIYRKIMLPLSKPAIATLIIFSFVNVWNDYMGPMIYLNSNELKTIQLGLRMFITQYSADYNLIMAAALISLIPVGVLFLSMQKFFIEGVATSGIKG